MDRAAVVAQPRPTIERRTQRSVETNDLGKLRDEQRRRDPKRRADHAPPPALLAGIAVLRG